MTRLASATHGNEDSSSSNQNKAHTPTASTMENYGATEDHEQSSLVSGLTTNGEDEDHMEDETHSLVAATIVGASTYVSNASSTSHYFQQHHKQKQPSHTHSDSLDYSTTSSTGSTLPPSIHTNEDRLSTRSYFGSIVQSLGHQQAFPSSMFPGQKLISPENSRETIQGADGHFENTTNISTTPSQSSRAYPSYYYFPQSAYRDSASSDGSRSSPRHSLPVRYQNARVGKNVYQKRRKPGFCPDEDLDHEIDDGSRIGWRCFFSPRVLVTLVVCGVILFNLLRLGGHHQHQSTTSKQHSSNIRGSTSSGTNKSSSGRSSVVDIDADYVKLEMIGGSSNNAF